MDIALSDRKGSSSQGRAPAHSNRASRRASSTELGCPSGSAPDSNRSSEAATAAATASSADSRSHIERGSLSMSATHSVGSPRGLQDRHHSRRLVLRGRFQTNPCLLASTAASARLETLSLR